MLKRKAMESIAFWKEHKTKQALLIDGARQVGKTFLVREFARENYAHFAEVNFVDNKMAAEAVSTASTADELFVRLSAFVEGELVPGSTLVFLDEIQKCDNVATTIKFLVDKFPEYDWVLSGSLLGVELKNTRSVPVGYLDSFTMYPLDFEEYCWAAGINDIAIQSARSSFEACKPIDEFLHERFMGLFHEYLIVGGMPAAVDAYFRERSIPVVRNVHENIIARYRDDISQYAPKRARVIKRIYDLMPAELSAQDKRFVISDVGGNAHFDRYENDFLWLVDAGVALATYNVSEPRPPLLVSQKSSMFKLFVSDVGLLTHLCGMDVVREILTGRRDVVFGGIYENVVAQELAAHGYPLYYFKSKAVGELDFVIEEPSSTALPIEVKSGKGYKRHSALNNALNTENYALERALVLCEDNVSIDEKGVVYAPAYCIAFVCQKPTISNFSNNRKLRHE